MTRHGTSQIRDRNGTRIPPGVNTGTPSPLLRGPQSVSQNQVPYHSAQYSVADKENRPVGTQGEKDHGHNQDGSEQEDDHDQEQSSEETDSLFVSLGDKRRKHNSHTGRTKKR